MDRNPQEETLQELRLFRAEYEAELKAVQNTEERFRYYRLIHQLDESIKRMEREVRAG